MCRNTKTLLNFESPATQDEIRAYSLQFTRKLRGFNAPSHANQTVFDHAVADVAMAASKLNTEFETNASPRNRERESARARRRNRRRFQSETQSR
ncbi:MAG: hypothetical protein CMO26_00410 [Thiotrichales bacterium]|nr:hypothetical protein [Thiotrichales bacterium]